VMIVGGRARWPARRTALMTRQSVLRGLATCAALDRGDVMSCPTSRGKAHIPRTRAPCGGPAPGEPESGTRPAMRARWVNFACVALFAIVGASSVDAREAATRSANAAPPSRSLLPSAADGGPHRAVESGARFYPSVPGPSGSPASPGLSSGHLLGRLFGHLVQNIFEVQSQNTAEVRAASQGILTGWNTGGLFTTQGESDLVASGRCILPPSLTVEQAERHGSALLGVDNYTAIVPVCPGSGAYYKVTGNACTYAEGDILGRLYDTGVAFMALGADSNEAFASFLHARTLGWTLRCCEPSLNPAGRVALPHSYAVLYGALNAKLSARLLESDRSTSASATGISKVLGCAPVRRKRNAALRTGLDVAFDADSLLPTAAEISSGLRTVFRAAASSSSNSNSTRVKATAEGDAMQEWQCDQNLPSVDQYTLRKLPGYMLDSRYEVCCSRECLLIETTTRSLTGSQNCCLGCNRFQCDALSAKGIREMSEASRVVVPGKDDAPPAIISIAV
jgi:hypothetical protein